MHITFERATVADAEALVKAQIAAFHHDAVLRARPISTAWPTCWSHSRARPGFWSVEVLLETTLEDAQQRIPPGNAIIKPVAGGVLVQLGVDRLDWMARTLMLLECPFVVRQPPELRDALLQLAADAAALAERVEV